MIRLLTYLAICLALGGNAYGMKDEYARSVPLTEKFKRAIEFIYPRKQQRSFAFIVGISNYNNEWQPIESAYEDAMRMRSFFKDSVQFDYVVTLTNEEASKIAIATYMEETFPNKIQQDDRFVFYFSGHGTQRNLADNRKRGYLAMMSSGKKNWATMISMDDIERWNENLQQAQVGHVLFILDCCCSGLAGIQSKSDSKQLMIDDLKKKGSHLITAGTGGQSSYASIKHWGGSLFTYALIEGMSGKADACVRDYDYDGIVSLNELVDYVNKQIKFEVSNGKLPNMTPQLRDLNADNEGQFFFITSKFITEKGSESDKSPIAFKLENKGNDKVDLMTNIQQNFSDQKKTTIMAPIGSDIDLKSSLINDSVSTKGRDVSGTSPVVVEIIEPSPDMIVDRKDSCKETKEGIVFADDRMNMNIALEKTLGTLLIESLPMGAEVYLNEKKVGVTNWQSKHQEPGSYKIKILLDDFKPVTDSLIILAGETIDRKYKLEKAVATNQTTANVGRKYQRIRRISFGTLAIACAGVGYAFEWKSNNDYDTYMSLKKYDQNNHEDNWKTVKTAEMNRNIFYILSALSTVGFVISIPF